jgi:hypothetical protein
MINIVEDHIQKEKKMLKKIHHSKHPKMYIGHHSANKIRHNDSYASSPKAHRRSGKKGKV